MPIPDLEPVMRTVDDMVDFGQELLVGEGVWFVDLLEEVVDVDLLERRLALRKKFLSWLVIDD